MLTPGFPISAFCQNITVYVLVVALFIFLIYHGLAVRQKLVLFPRRFVGVTTLLSAVSTLPVFVSALVI